MSAAGPQSDQEIALDALARRTEAWFRFTPETVDGPGGDAIRDAIDAFEGTESAAGLEASEWLREHALDNHGSTVTWVMVNEGEVQGFYAMASASVRLSQSHRKRLKIRSPHVLNPTQPASLIAWIARSRNAPAGTGRRIFQHAVSSALEVSEMQGNIAIVVDAYDAATATMWMEKYGMRKSSRDGRSEADWESHPRLWAPLLGSD